MSEHRPRVLVDMDDVVADFYGELIRHLEANDPPVEIIDFNQYYLSRCIKNPEYFLPIINEIKNAPGFFRDLPPVEGAIDGWNNMIELGYNPVIDTAPLESNPTCVEDKKAWIDYQFGSRAVDEALFHSDKTGDVGVALIDDKPQIAGAHVPVWQQIHFHTSYNRDVVTDFRLRGWKDPNLSTLLADCAAKSPL